MALIAAILVVALFIVLLFAFGIVERSRDVIALARESARVMNDKSLSDDDKEVAIQKSAVRMLGLSFYLLVAFAAALLLPVAVVWVAQLAGLASLEETIDVLLRWDFMAVATVVGIAAYYMYVWIRR